MASSQSGKAILTVEKDGDTLYPTIIALTGLHTERQHQWLCDSMELSHYCDWLPPQCARMESGDKITFKVSFEQNYYKGDGYSSDDDEELIFTKVVKLRHRRGSCESRRALKKFYRSKRK